MVALLLRAIVICFLAAMSGWCPIYVLRWYIDYQTHSSHNTCICVNAAGWCWTNERIGCGYLSRRISSWFIVSARYVCPCPPSGLWVKMFAPFEDYRTLIIRVNYVVLHIYRTHARTFGGGDEHRLTPCTMNNVAATGQQLYNIARWDGIACWSIDHAFRTEPKIYTFRVPFCL